MQYLITVLIITFSAFRAYTQSSPPQQADYNIYAKLDTSQQKLEAQATVLYHNNSGETLTEIWFHLWANGYSSKNTSLAKELIEAHNPSLYFLKQKELGGYTDISFRQGENELIPYYSDDEKQIVRLVLDQPLSPGSKAEISIRYTMKIPKNILGYGYDGSQFILANWYPKAAVYREGKWEVQVLNSQNLFSADVGKYHVTLSIPEKYTVASSGTSVPFHVSESLTSNLSIEKSGYKTVSFADPGTKDFAWIADSNLHSIPLSVNLEDGRKYELEIITDKKELFDKNLEKFNPFLLKLTEFVQANMPGCLPGRYVIFSSVKITHPTPFANLVTTDLYAKNSDYYENLFKREELTSDLILMGLTTRLEENPIEKPWMYLGMGTYYFTRFMEESYPGKKEKSGLFITMTDRKNWYVPECAICFKPALLSLTSYHCKDDVESYLVNPATVHFNYLEKVMGVQSFDHIMTAYFSQPPTGKDFQKNLKDFFSNQTGQDFHWFFNGMMGSFFPFKYEIQKIDKNGGQISVDVQNTGDFNPPYMIGLKNRKNVVDSLLVEGHAGTTTWVFEASKSNKVVLDPFYWVPKTKWLKQSAYIKKPNLQALHYGLPFSAREIPGFAIDPIIGFNVNDGLMLGGMLSSGFHNFIAQVIPLYGFRSDALTGALEIYKKANISADSYLSGKFIAKSFHRMRIDDKALRYYVINPAMQYVFQGKESCEPQKVVEVVYNFIGDQIFGSEGIIDYQRYIANFNYYDQRKHIINPYSYKIGLEHQYYNLYEKRHYLRVDARLNTSYAYKPNRYIHARLYGATYLFNSHFNSTNTMPGTLSLIGYNMNDYAYDHLLFFDRSAQDGFWSRQISMHTGGFKTAISNAYGVGQSNRFVASVNLKMDLPFGTFIKPFFDFGVYGYLPTVSEGYSTKTLYSAGLIFEIFKDNFEIYLPLFNSKEIEDKYKESYENPFWGKFSFSFVDFNLIF